MPADERTSLLQYSQVQEEEYTGHGTNGYHVIQVPKDDYELILSLTDCTCGLSLEELLPYKDDPWWQNLRRFLFYSFWFILGSSCMIACCLSYWHDGSCTGKAVKSQGQTSSLMGVTSTASDGFDILSSAAIISATKIMP